MDKKTEPEEKMAENGGGENHEIENTSKKKKKDVGGMKTMPFILASEICDRFASTGSHANMITYLTNELNMPLVKASNTLTNFGGTATSCRNTQLYLNQLEIKESSSCRSEAVITVESSRDR
ncbi:hypothetical protein Vadar_033414 [Vaccinium darrowii]|uniref:Uncharacterized protein n=1 Tax=Vaccinium darrowii TaxID=229202 RepID=A0ACB7XV78_9ERIC|nr:hypothetical protein Vadar_033414 [Vaccinium darrowii]